jgi:hypothetical protein
MHPAALLALLAILMLALAALRLERNFRLTCKDGGEPRMARPDRRPPGHVGGTRAPELRAAPAGGYWQAPIPPRRSA